MPVAEPKESGRIEVQIDRRFKLPPGIKSNWFKLRRVHIGQYTGLFHEAIATLENTVGEMLESEVPKVYLDLIAKVKAGLLDPEKLVWSYWIFRKWGRYHLVLTLGQWSQILKIRRGGRYVLDGYFLSKPLYEYKIGKAEWVRRHKERLEQLGRQITRPLEKAIAKQYPKLSDYSFSIYFWISHFNANEALSINQIVERLQDAILVTAYMHEQHGGVFANHPKLEAMVRSLEQYGYEAEETIHGLVDRVYAKTAENQQLEQELADSRLPYTHGDQSLRPSQALLGQPLKRKEERRFMAAGPTNRLLIWMAVLGGLGLTIAGLALGRDQWVTVGVVGMILGIVLNFVITRFGVRTETESPRSLERQPKLPPLGGGRMPLGQPAPAQQPLGVQPEERRPQ